MEGITEEKVEVMRRWGAILKALDDVVSAGDQMMVEMERITGDEGLEPERFRERMRAVWVMDSALSAAKRARKDMCS